MPKPEKASPRCDPIILPDDAVYILKGAQMTFGLSKTSLLTEVRNGRLHS